MAFKPFKINILNELDISIPKKNRKAALEDAANLLKEQMLSYIAEGRSPISGGRWIKTLTPEYKALKESEGGSDTADLELSGSLLDSLDVKVSGNSIVIDVADDQRGKAEGHYFGLYGKNSRIRPRQFAPQKGDTFKAKILSDLKNLLSDYEE